MRLNLLTERNYVRCSQANSSIIYIGVPYLLLTALAETSNTVLRYGNVVSQTTGNGSRKVNALLRGHHVFLADVEWRLVGLDEENTNRPINPKNLK